MMFLLPLFARLGVPESLRRPVAVATTVVAVAALCGLLWTCWLRDHDRDVIDRHEAGIEKQIGEATGAANETANANDTRRQVENARADELTREAIRDAEAQHPDEVRRDSGPATRNVLGELRKRAPSPRTPPR